MYIPVTGIIVFELNIIKSIDSPTGLYRILNKAWGNHQYKFLQFEEFYDRSLEYLDLCPYLIKADK